MIINTQEKKGSRYIPRYYNLASRTSYYLVFNEFSETAIDVPAPFEHEEVEKLIVKELWNAQTNVDNYKAIPELAYQNSTDIIRLQKAIKYLTNYENN
jgi:hypothetical protein